MAANLSEKVLGLQKVDSERIIDLISNVLSDKHKNKEFKPDDLLELMSSDKKRKGNQLNFVLLNSIGSAEICSDIDDQEILNSIKLT